MCYYRVKNKTQRGLQRGDFQYFQLPTHFPVDGLPLHVTNTSRQLSQTPQCSSVYQFSSEEMRPNPLDPSFKVKPQLHPMRQTVYHRTDVCRRTLPTAVNPNPNPTDHHPLQKKTNSLVYSILSKSQAFYFTPLH